MQNYFSCFWSQKLNSGVKRLWHKKFLNTVGEKIHFLICQSWHIAWRPSWKSPPTTPHCISSAPAFPIGLRLILLIFSTGRINALSISDLGDHWKAINSNRSDSKVLVPPYGISWLSQGSVPHRQILDRTVTSFDMSTCIFYDSWWPVVYFEMG